MAKILSILAIYIIRIKMTIILNNIFNLKHALDILSMYYFFVYVNVEIQFLVNFMHKS
jgi:hypothetical protein